jgi:hypothetical protein
MNKLIKKEKIYDNKNKNKIKNENFYKNKLIRENQLVSNKNHYFDIHIGGIQYVVYVISSNDQYYIFFVFKDKIVRVSKAFFKNFEGIITKYRDILIKSSGGSRFVLTKFFKERGVFDFLALKGEGLFDLANFEGIADFLQGVRMFFKASAFVGKVSKLGVNQVSLLLFKLSQTAFKLFKLLSTGLNELDLIDLVFFIWDSFNFVNSVAPLWNGGVFKGESLTELAISTASFLLPSDILLIVKRLQMFTNTKILDDFTLLSDLSEIFYELISKIISYSEIVLPDELNSIVKKFFDPRSPILLQSMRNCSNKWSGDKKIVLMEDFRIKVKQLEQQRLMIKDDLSEWARKSPLAQSRLSDFQRLYKCVLAYESSSRIEPACFIFEGPPGTMKSSYINKAISVLGLSSYSHSTQSIESGKDWYDAYNDEDIFYMDDVGSQGISQWRNIVNFVSPVKMPLDCASADLKDTKFFNSKVLLLTTNRFSDLSGLVRSDGISDLRALWRRGYSIDFSKVKRVANFLVGRIYFKYFDVLSNKWVFDFPDDLKQHFVNNNIRIDANIEVDFGSDYDFVAWLTLIIENAINVKFDQYQSNQYSPSDISSVRNVMTLYKAEDKTESDSIIQDYYLYFKDKVLSTFSLVSIKFRDNYMNILYCGVGGLISLGLYEYLRGVYKRSFIAEFEPDEKVKQLLVPKVELHPSVMSISKQVFVGSFNYQLNGKSVNSQCHVLLTNRFVVTVSHICETDVAYLKVYKDFTNNHRILDNIKVTNIFRNKSNDLSIWALPSNFPTPFKDISHIFNQEGVRIKNTFMISSQGVFNISTLLRKNLYMSVPYSIKIVDKVTTNYIQEKDMLYDNFHYTGLCGAVVTSDSGKYMGMHVAGSDGENIGVALSLSAEVLREVYAILSNLNSFVIPYDISDKILKDFNGIKLNNNSHFSTPKNSNYIKSPLYEIFPISRIPANLTVNGNHTVKDVAKKSFKPVYDVDIDEIAFGKEVVKVLIEPFTDLSMKEVILGNELLAGLNKKSSSGFGFKNGKDTYIDYENGSLKPDFEKIYENFYQDMKSGKVNSDSILWFETLKDELRSTSKILPRSFRVSTILVQLITKQVFGNMVVSIIRNRSFNEIMIGINPYQEWPLLYADINKCKKVWAGDIGGWDGCMLPQVQVGINEILVEACVDNKQLASYILGLLPFCLVGINDDTFLTTHSMPSGSFLTAIYNSLVNRFYTGMWFYRNMKKGGFKPTVSSFYRIVMDKTYGDDKLNGLRDLRYENYLNAVTMKEFFNSVGMDFTDSKKMPIVSKFQDIGEITFLKRSFVYHSLLQQIVGPLDKSTLYSTLSWVDSSKDVDIVLEDKINAFQREIFLHEELYDNDIMKLTIACEKLSIPFKKLPKNYLVYLYKKGDYMLYDELYGIYINKAKTIVDMTDNSFAMELGTDDSGLVAQSLLCVAKHDSDKILALDSLIKEREEGFFSKLHSKATNNTVVVYDKWPEITTVPKELKMDYSRIIDKPFFVENILWDDTLGSGALLGYFNVPKILFDNSLIVVPFSSSCFYRMKVCLSLQVAGTPMHSGTVIASVVPNVQVPSDINQLMSASHVFLSANESTASCIEVPFYSSEVLKRTGTSDILRTGWEDYARLYIMVINPLLPPAGGSTSLSVSIHARITDAEFYVPRSYPPGVLPEFSAEALSGKEGLFSIPTKIFDGLATGAKIITGDIIDIARNTLRAYTGFHNPNSPAINQRAIVGGRNFPNNVDQPTLYEKLDQHAQFDRITYDYLFDTSIDEMDMQYLLSKPVYINTIKLTAATAEATKLFSYPITPCFELFNTGYSFFSPTRLLYESSLYWRGSLKLHIQSSMNNFQYCKLAVTRDYDTLLSTPTLTPTLHSVQNLLTDTLEFSAGGQVQTVEIPYCNTLEQVPCSKDIKTLPYLTGLIHIYVVQPLVINGVAPLEASFNIYMSCGPDFQFYGYSNDSMEPAGVLPTEGAPTVVDVKVPSKVESDEKSITVAEDWHNTRINSKNNNQSEIIFKAEAEVTVVPSDHNEILNSDVQEENTFLRSLDFKPMVSIRDYIRRMVPAYQSSYGPSPLPMVIDITSMFRTSGQTLMSTPILMRSMYYGMTGGVKIKIRVIGSTNASFKYIPPGSMASTANRMGATTPLVTITPYQANFANREKLVAPADLQSSTPFVEAPSYYSRAQVDRNSVIYADFVIPNMSPYRFLSNTFLVSNSLEADASMGNIVINFYDAPLEDSVEVTVWLGFTDETRFGQQTMFRGAFVPAVSGRRTQSDYNDTHVGGPLVDLSGLPGMYYCKTT